MSAAPEPGARLLDGRALAARIRAECKDRIDGLRAVGTVPGLAVVLVGDHPASQVYVRHKVAACDAVGMASRVLRLPATTPEDEVIAQIHALNGDDSVHGILVQLPLPPDIDLRRVLEAVSPDKDVDGFHPANVGALATGESRFPPCTPHGVMVLLEAEGIDVAGRNVVIVGASNIVGKPMAQMMLRAQATVSVCHARTRDLAEFTRLADILVVAAGVPGLITGAMLKPGVVVIDVGINRLPDGRLTGDVDVPSVTPVASAISPVPGGVGPMTVTMLIVNTLQAAQRIAVAQAERRARPAPFETALC